MNTINRNSAHLKISYICGNGGINSFSRQNRVGELFVAAHIGNRGVRGRDITALDNITEYFRRLYRIKGESLDIKKILDKFKDGNYQFATVAGEFNLIEENTVTVYINREPEAEALLQEILQQGLTKSRMRKAGQYCVSVRKKGEYEKRNMLFEEMRDAGMVEAVDLGAQDFYVLTQEEQYREDTGLKLEVELGGMMMF